jgi:hypothetical protein
VEQRDYQKACITDTVNSLNDEKDILINLPTGTGKTMIYGPITAELFERNLRTLVLTATKQAQRRVKSEIEKFLTGIGESTLIYGIQEYECPILGRKAENWYCAENKEECRKARIACEVIESDREYAEKSLVVTNFAKFLLSRFGGKYDVIVLDDSHSFENSKEQAYQLTIQGASGRRVFETGMKNETLQSFISDFLNIYAEVFERCIAPTEKEGVVSPEYIMSFAALAKRYDLEELRKQIAKIAPENGRDICWSVYYFVRRCTKASRFQFFIRSDYYDPEDWDSSELISRKDDVSYIIKKRFDNSCIVYATATPGDALKHAASCSLRMYTANDLAITPSKKSIYPEIKNWFQRLHILVITDIGDTRQIIPFNEAIDLTTKILRNRKERALVLFKNYRDQNKAHNLLTKIFNQDELFFIESSNQDSDFVEELASRTQISLASASSTLWEGINIKDLRIAIVVTAPFIRPPVGKKGTYPDLERRMLVRLQQGIGRIIREPTDFGVAVLMDSRFQTYVKRKNFDGRLFERIQFLSSDEVMSQIDHALFGGD